MNAYLLPSIEFGPVVVKRLIGLIPRSGLDKELEKGRFTPREVIAHLADWEPIMRDRIQQTVSDPGSILEAHDEVQMGIDHRYAESNPGELLVLFVNERKKTAEYLRSLAVDDWKQSVVHPERGIQSAEDLANLLLGHDLYHIEQLSAYLE